MRNKIIIGLAVFAAILAAIWLLPVKPRAGPWRLADGSELSLAGVTYGKKHVMHFGGGIADYLYPILSPALRKKFGCKEMMMNTTDTNAIVLWFWDKGVRVSLAGGFRGYTTPPYCITTADERGMESEPVTSAKSMRAVGATNILHGWELKQFPRRASEVGIRLYAAAPNRQKQEYLGEFKIPNRLRRSFPVWNAEPLPMTVKTNGLEVTLAKFETGGKEYMFLPDRKDTNYVSDLGFTLAENQRRADDNWRIVSGSATAASGETRDSWGWLESPGYDGLSYILHFHGTFWMEEPAWKLRVKVSRIANFPQDELWSVCGVTVAPRGKIVNLNLKTNMHGSEIELFAINGPMTNFNDGVRSTIGNVPDQLNVRSPLPALDRHLQIVEIKDNLGRNVAFEWDEGVPSTGGRGATMRELIQVFPITIPEGAESLDVTFAYTQSHFVEFIAKPTVAKQAQ